MLSRFVAVRLANPKRITISDDSVVPPLAPPDAAPCNLDNRPGPGPPPFDTPLRPGRHVGLGYEHDARLLTAAEREAGPI